MRACSRRLIISYRDASGSVRNYLPDARIRAHKCDETGRYSMKRSGVACGISVTVFQLVGYLSYRQRKMSARHRRWLSQVYRWHWERQVSIEPKQTGRLLREFLSPVPHSFSSDPLLHQCSPTKASVFSARGRIPRSCFPEPLGFRT